MAVDFQEMAAAVNTQLRFGKHKEALIAAYKLRIELQTANHMNAEMMRQLETAEQVIDELERMKSGRFGRWLGVFWNSLRDAFNPASRQKESEAGGDEEPKSEGEEAESEGRESTDAGTDSVSSANEPRDFSSYADDDEGASNH